MGRRTRSVNATPLASSLLAGIVFRSVNSSAAPSAAPAPSRRFHLLSIVIPTYNESENVPILINAIESALPHSIPFEIIVVDDDSPDRTWELVEKLALTRENLRVVRRVHKRGLSSAIFDGFSCARGDAVMVIDADLQHDEAIIPEMLKALGENAIVIGSRYVKGGLTDKWSKRRKFLSAAATKLSQYMLGVRVKDPMSGFFMLRREVFDACSAGVNQRGFKLLMEIIHASRHTDIAEIPYTFKPRKFGASKLDYKVGVDFLLSLWDLKFGRILPVRFMKYAAVGLSGVIVNVSVLQALKHLTALTYQSRLVIAIGAAMLSNFLLNNRFTFRDTEAGSVALRMLLFILVCAVGWAINYSVANALFQHVYAQEIVADLAGIFIATIWNYVGSKTIVWRTADA